MLLQTFRFDGDKPFSLYGIHEELGPVFAEDGVTYWETVFHQQPPPGGTAA